MNLDIHAYITTSYTTARVQRLNEAVINAEVLPIIGGSGSGKRTFLQWWWLAGCTLSAFAGTHVLVPRDVVLVDALCPSGVSVASVVLTNLEVGLLALERSHFNGERIQPLAKARSFGTSRQIASQMHCVIVPLVDQVAPQAIVVTNAHYLDYETLSWLVELHAPIRRTTVRRPELGLILCGNTSLPGKIQPSFKKILDATGLTRTALPDALVYEPLQDDAEFAETMVNLVTINLRTVPGTDIEWKEIVTQFADWTQRDWFRIRKLLDVADVYLGPQRGDEPRVLTWAVMNEIERRWLKREPSATSAS